LTVRQQPPNFDHRNEQYRYNDSFLVERSSFRSNAPLIWLHELEAVRCLSLLGLGSVNAKANFSQPMTSSDM
jgi:hypothetical protein